jgi:hypothetical protein
MSRYQRKSAAWRYFVREGKVFCPNRTADIDVANCAKCPHLASEADAGTVVCRPPAGGGLSEMIEAVTRY